MKTSIRRKVINHPPFTPALQRSSFSFLLLVSLFCAKAAAQLSSPLPPPSYQCTPIEPEPLVNSSPTNKKLDNISELVQGLSAQLSQLQGQMRALNSVVIAVKEAVERLELTAATSSPSQPTFSVPGAPELHFPSPPSPPLLFPFPSNSYPPSLPPPSSSLPPSPSCPSTPSPSCPPPTPSPSCPPPTPCFSSYTFSLLSYTLPLLSSSYTSFSSSYTSSLFSSSYTSSHPSLLR